MERFLLFFEFSLLWLTCWTDEDFCNKGFQVAAKYHRCWQDAQYSHKYPDLYEPHETLDASFLEKYANHMCSVVKPDALGCFKKDVKGCSNRAKLIGIADESGGACQGQSLSPFFKKHVINYLVPVTGNQDSPCYTIGDESYNECYMAAGKKVLESGMSDEISRFHKVADLLFNSYWDCLIDVYKSKADLCPNWQIPMLLVLQKTALPNLFGMLLTPHHVQKLELQSPNSIKGNTTKPGKQCENKATKNSYLLIQLLSKRPTVKTSDNSMVLELANLEGDQPTLLIQGAQDDRKAEVTNFLNILSGPNTESSLKERRRKRKDEQKKNKALENLNRKLKGEDVATKKNKKRKKTKGRRKGKKNVKKNRSKPNENEMIE